MTIEEYKEYKRRKAQGGGASTATPSAVVVSNPREGFGQTPDDGGFSVVEPSAQSSMNVISPFEEFMNTTLSPLQENTEQYRPTSIFPEDYGEGAGAWAMENLFNPIAKPLEQFGRIIPATGYEIARAADVGLQMPGWADRAQRENPFVPGMESATQGENATMIGQRALKAMFDVATLGKGSSILKGGKVALSQVPKLMAEGALLGAGQSMSGTDAPKVSDVAVGAGAGAILNPVASAAMHGATQVARKLLGRPAIETMEEATNNLVTETALVKNPTPYELAMERMKQRQFQVQAQDISGGMPVGTRNPVTGAIEVPPGGFQPFQSEGSAQLRQPMGAFSVDGVGSRGTTAAPLEGQVIDTQDMPTQLLEQLLGKKKTRALQRQVIEGTVGEPFPSPERILVQPKGMRPAPVLGRYAIEKPYITQLPEPVQEIIKIADNIVDDVRPVIDDVPTEMKDPSRFQQFKHQWEVAARNFWQPMQTSVRKLGKAGEQLSKKIDDFRAQQFTSRGKMQVELDKDFKGITNLSDAEWENAFLTVEGKATAMNERVAKAVDAHRKFSLQRFNENLQRGMDNMVDESGSPNIDPNYYVSHQYNQKGWDVHNKKPNAFFRRVAEHNMKAGESIEQVMADFREDWKFIQKNMTPKSFFEKKRTWSIPPEWMEHNLHRIDSRYADSASKRYALIDHFGQPGEDGYPQIKQLINNIALESGDSASKFADNMMDLIVGRGSMDYEMRNLAADIAEHQLISKLGPISTIANISQGFNGSILKHGFKHALVGLKSMTSAEGREWARKTGLIGESYLSSRQTSRMSKIWQKISGFPLSEDINFTIATNSAKDFLKGLYPKLVASPNDKAIRNHFLTHGLDPDTLLKQGSITEDDLLKGSFMMARDTIFPRMVEQAVGWANNPAGKVLYQFAHFGLKQPELLGQQFKISKSRGMKQLIKYLAASAVTGEVTSDIWAAIKDRDRPEDPLGRIASNLLGSGVFGFPGEAIRTWSEGYGDAIRPGPFVGGMEKTIKRLISDAQAGDAGKMMEDLIRAKVRGDLPIGPAIPGGANLEAMWKREPVNSKKNNNKFKKVGGFEGAKSFSSPVVN